MLFGNKEHKNFNPRDTFIGGVVLLFIASIFFIPELVRLTKNIGMPKSDVAAVKTASEKESKPAKSPDEKASLKVAEQEQVSDNPLDQVLTRFDKKKYNTQQKLQEIEQKSETKKNTGGKATSFLDRLFGRTGTGNQPISVAKSGAGKKKVSQQLQLEKIVAAGEITWKVLSNKDVSAAIKDAQKKSVSIQKQLDTSAVASSEAMDRYINTLYKITGGSFKNFKAKDVITFLATMDKNVTKAFAAERVPRSIYVQWLQLGLDPLLRDTDAPALKRQLLPTFRVDIVLTNVKATDQIKKNQYTRRMERVRSNIAVTGIIQGNDASELEIYRGAELVQRKAVKFNKKKPENPIKFSFRYRSVGDTNGISGNYIVRIKDEAGNYYQKVYRFDPTIRNFRQSKNGSFQMPKLDSGTAAKTRAYDSYFAVAESGTDVESSLGIDSQFGGGYDSLNDGIQGMSSF